MNRICIFVVVLLCSAEDNSKVYEKLHFYIKRGTFLDSSPLSILDVGAHNGLWSTGLSNTGYFPNADYFLIEGNAAHKTALDATKYPYVISLVCDVDGKEVIYHKADTSRYSDSGNSIYREQTTYFQDSESTHESRHCYTIDSILEAGGYSMPFQIIKFDIQGAEYDALVGAANTIRMSDPLIVTEVSILPFNGPEAASILDITIIMAQYGFNMLDIADTHYLDVVNGAGGVHQTVLQLDILWARPEHVLFMHSKDSIGVWNERMKWKCERLQPSNPSLSCER